jgi:hypothetical protein
MLLMNHPMFWFLSGVLTAWLVWLIWALVEAVWAARAAEKKAAALTEGEPQSDAERQAWEKVKECKNRLRLQPHINPQWIKPVREESVQLVREIAEIFYPDSEEPLLEPGASEFMRAIELTANDIATFLQNNRIGRLLDMSAGTMRRTYSAGRKILKDKRLSFLSKYYGKIRPAAQALRYKSPVTWASLIGRNVAVRTIQPIMIEFVGRRAIQLYSGKLGKEGLKPNELKTDHDADPAEVENS